MTVLERWCATGFVAMFCLALMFALMQWGWALEAAAFLVPMVSLGCLLALLARR